MDSGKDHVRLWRTVTASGLLAAVLLVMLVVPLSAHVIIEQIVTIDVEPHGDQLVVRMHVPVTVLGEANLPRLSSGVFDVTAIEGPLRIAAADIARNLDVQQDGVVLPEPVVTGRVGADGVSVDLELKYATRADTAEFSARLNAFQSNDGPVRTNVRYRLPSGQDPLITVTGPPVRIGFDPGTIDVLQQFAARAVRALLDGGDHLLFLVCVLLPVRRGRTAIVLFRAAALGQLIAMAILVLRPTMSAPSLTALAMIAASVVVVAALQNIVQANLRWAVLLAHAFGALNGFAFGGTLALSGQFAGSHTLMAGVVFAAVVLLGEFWLGALVWATRAWLDEIGVPERLVSILVSVIIGHAAIHRVVDRGQILAAAGSFGAERSLVWLTLGWACVMMLVALARALSGRPLDSVDPLGGSKAAQGS